MENIQNNPQEVGPRSVPARVQDITLMSELLELTDTHDRIQRCLSGLDACASSADIDAEVEACAREIGKRLTVSSERLERLSKMLDGAGTKAEVQRARFADLDFFLSNPDLALTSHRNMALAAMAAAQAWVAAAWATAGLLTNSTLPRLRMTLKSLRPQIEHLKHRLAQRRRELEEQYPHLVKHSCPIELNGVDAANPVWVLKEQRAAR